MLDRQGSKAYRYHSCLVCNLDKSSLLLILFLSYANVHPEADAYHELEINSGRGSCVHGSIQAKDRSKPNSLAYRLLALMLNLLAYHSTVIFMDCVNSTAETRQGISVSVRLAMLLPSLSVGRRSNAVAAGFSYGGVKAES